MSLLDRAVVHGLPFVPKPIVGMFSKRYIAGPLLEDAFRVARQLEGEGAMSTIDILGEFIKNAGEGDANADQYIDLVRRIAAERFADVNVSVKLTALGLTLDRARCLANMRRLMAAVRDAGLFARIDMEDSPWTDATCEIYRTLRAEFPGKVGVAIQSRLRRTLDDVEALTAQPANFRLCKGIYLEPRPIGYTERDIIRDNYMHVLRALLSRGSYVGIATHDEWLVCESLALVDELSLTPDRYEFQMLLGVDPLLRRTLLAAGHRLRVYVPFGEDWYKYSVRRLKENPSIAGHVVRTLVGLGPS